MMSDHLTSTLFIAAEVIALTIIVFGLIQNAVYLVQLIIAGKVLSRRSPVTRSNLLWQRYASHTPPISILSPAYNEAATIVESVKSMLSLQYPRYEVVVINDGSRDETMQRLKEAFQLQPIKRIYNPSLPHAAIRNVYGTSLHSRLIVIDKENGGKADALNAGINVSQAPVFCSIDADSILDPDSLLRAVRPFVDDPERTIAVGGTVRLANGCKVEHGRLTKVALPRSPLALLQVVEYLRAFLMARLAWSHLGALTIISGAFGLFRRDTALAAGGYATGTVGEDMELVVRLHRHMRDTGQDYRISYVPEPVCWTEAPESLSILGRQRSRWQRGSLETFQAHHDMLMRPRYGRVGTIAFLNILVTDVLGPLVELVGYFLIPLFWAMGILSLDYLLAFLSVTFAFGVAVSVCAVLLEEMQLKRFPSARDLVVLMLAAIAENFGYRQMCNVWRLQGWWQYLRRSGGWGEMTRKGFGASA